MKGASGGGGGMERGDPLVRWWVGWSATSPTTPWSAGCRCACPYTAPGRSPTAASSGHPRAVAERPCVQVGRPRHAHLLHPGTSYTCTYLPGLHWLPPLFCTSVSSRRARRLGRSRRRRGPARLKAGRRPGARALDGVARRRIRLPRGSGRGRAVRLSARARAPPRAQGCSA